jgi:hypothetical protein
MMHLALTALAYFSVISMEVHCCYFSENGNRTVFQNAVFLESTTWIRLRILKSNCISSGNNSSI